MTNIKESKVIHFGNKILKLDDVYKIAQLFVAEQKNSIKKS